MGAFARAVWPTSSDFSEWIGSGHWSSAQYSRTPGNDAR
jgi:hypothetical protein